MKVRLDENKYFTGEYVIVGDMNGGVEVNELPQFKDIEKQKSCKYENEKWIFNEEKYQEIQNNKKLEEVDKEILMLKKELEDTDYKIVKCSECQLVGEELPYNITELHKTRQALRDKINILQTK